jgi:hypothetical protein
MPSRRAWSSSQGLTVLSTSSWILPLRVIIAPSALLEFKIARPFISFAEGQGDWGDAGPRNRAGSLVAPRGFIRVGLCLGT